MEIVESGSIRAARQSGTAVPGTAKPASDTRNAPVELPVVCASTRSGNRITPEPAAAAGSAARLEPRSGEAGFGIRCAAGPAGVDRRFPARPRPARSGTQNAAGCKATSAMLSASRAET